MYATQTISNSSNNIYCKLNERTSRGNKTVTFHNLLTGIKLMGCLKKMAPMSFSWITFTIYLLQLLCILRNMSIYLFLQIAKFTRNCFKTKKVIRIKHVKNVRSVTKKCDSLQKPQNSLTFCEINSQLIVLKLKLY